MLLSGFTSPRKLALLAVFVFFIAIVFLQSSSYSALTNNGIPGFGSNDDGKSSPELDHDGKSSLEEDKGSRPGTAVETPQKRPTGLPGKVAWSTPASLSDSVDGATTTKFGMHSPSTPPSSTQTDSAYSTPTLLSNETHEAIQSKIQDLIKSWTPPLINGHWPPYDWYGDQDYDPNRWEGFQWDNDFYVSNGIKKLAEQEPSAAAPTPYLPYPDYNSQQWKKEWRGEHVPCEGARGKLLSESKEDIVLAYPALPKAFPDVAIGDANITGIDINHCFDRYHRFGPYGYEQGNAEEVDDYDAPVTKPDWSSVHWGQLQDQCLVANKERYQPNARQPINLKPGKELPKDAARLPTEAPEPPSTAPLHKTRTALLIRTWEGYEYTNNDLEAIRALITELSLLSGGEYQVFLFVNVKDSNADIWTNERVYKDILEQNVPRELQSISILWNEKIFAEWYPKVGDWQVYWHQFMPLQWFSKMHPEFEYVWNWETDARYTGSHYELLEGVAKFAKGTPRKYLWERNQRFYFPSAHGSYEQWWADTHAIVEAAVQDGTMNSVWGPQPYNETWQTPIGPKPPHTLANDSFTWGVGEEADLITLQPIWEPTHTEWTLRDKIWNFLPGIRPHFTPQDPLDEEFHHPEFAKIPRRTYINTLSRFSRRQLHAMHLENSAGRTMQAEMWPATVALQHGLKAVYAPHPIWADRRWPGWYMDAIFNADGGEAARWGARADSVYNHDREHNFVGWSWYYNSEFPRTLYRRWLGWRASVGEELQYPNNPLRELGGKEYEEKSVKVHFPPREADGSQAAPPGGSSFGGREVMVGGMGRMCLPPMLLHPVKHVEERAG